MQAQHSWQHTIVSEMAVSRNCRLAAAARVDDFVVSEHLISMLICQISQDRNIARVYQTLLDSAGGEIAIGYRRSAAAAQPPSYGVIINPDKTVKIRLDDCDKLIVIAKD